MTTIAWDGKTLAVDRASWQGSYVWSSATKLFHVDDASVECCKRFRLTPPPGNQSHLVWAAAGDPSLVPLALMWMQEGGEIPTMQAKSPTTLGLILEVSTRRISRLNSRMTLERLNDAPVAEGGGFEIALGAMLAGATAVQAIELVASRSGWAAGGVDSFHCSPPRTLSRSSSITYSDA